MPATSSSVGSGAAGAAVFADSDSRKYRYFDPRGKRASHYEDMTVDVQPDPERYLIQDWIIAFPNGRGRVRQVCHPRQEFKLACFPRTRSGMGTHPLSASVDHRRHDPERRAERTSSRCSQGVRQSLVKVLQTHLGAWKHAEFGLGTSLMQAQRYGYTQMINNATLTNSSYKLRLAQDLTLYLAEIGLDIDGLDDDGPGRKPGWRIDVWKRPESRSKPSWDRRGLPGAVFRHQYLRSNRWWANCSDPVSWSRSQPPTVTSSPHR